MSATRRPPTTRVPNRGLWMGAWLMAAALRVVDGQATVRGVVYDSVSRSGLRAASVQLVPVDPALLEAGRRTAQTDSTGAFEAVGVIPGRYLIGFFHARLDSLGIEPPVRRVEVRAGRPVTIELAVPSPESVVAAWCGPKAASDSLGVVLGFARDPASAATWAGASITAQWTTITLSPVGARAGVQGTSTRSSSRGWFALCGVPRGGTLVLRAALDGDSSSVLEVEVPDDGVLRRDVAFTRGTAAAAAPPVVRGTVLDANGQPVAGARVGWWGTSAEVRSGNDGLFALPALALGTHLLEARMIGFVPTRQVVDVHPGHEAPLAVSLPEFPVDIDTVRVLARAPRRPEALGGFERRRQRGQGIYLDAELIERRRPLVFTDLVRSLPGVAIRDVDQMTRTVLMQSSNGVEPCTPVLVIDGARVPMLAMNLDDVIPADLVRAVEVYPRRMQAPPQFQGTECGTLVIWTGLRGWMARPRAGRSP